MSQQVQALRLQPPGGTSERRIAPRGGQGRPSMARDTGDASAALRMTALNTQRTISLGGTATDRQALPKAAFSVNTNSAICRAISGSSSEKLLKPQA